MDPPTWVRNIRVVLDWQVPFQCWQSYPQPLLCIKWLTAERGGAMVDYVLHKSFRYPNKSTPLTKSNPGMIPIAEK